MGTVDQLPLATATPGLISLAAAARRMGIGVNTSYTWVKEGKFPIPVHRVGTRFKIKVAELEAFLQGAADRIADDDATAV